MKKLLFILSVVMFLMGCAATKTSITSVTATHDTLMVHDTVQVVQHDSTYVDRYVHDSVLGLSGTSIGILADSNMDTVIVKGGVSLTMSHDKNGKQHITCKEDSLTLVIHNLVTEKTFLQRSLDSTKFSNTVMGRNSDVQVTKEKTKELPWYLQLWNKIRNVLAWIGVAAVLYVVYRLLKKFGILKLA
jgi:hypothetical protein